ncbi:MAG: 50S ribosomal protein L4 [bacterium]
MNKTKVYNINGEVVEDIELNPNIFDIELNIGLVHQAAEAQLANARQILAHTKDRGEVRGGGKKPWKQKGTGRARHGSIRSPLWVGGGVTFGPRNTRNFTKQINKKMKKKALFMCLSDKAKSGWIILLKDLDIDKAKTGRLLDILKKLPVFETKVKKIKPINKAKDKKLNNKQAEKNMLEIKEIAKSLIIIPQKQEPILLSARNLKNIEIIKADSLNVVDVLKYKYLIMPLDSLKVIEKTYLKPAAK